MRLHRSKSTVRSDSGVRPFRRQPEREPEHGAAPIAPNEPETIAPQDRPNTEFDASRQPAIPSTPADLPDELIAARAYEIWERRGRPEGESEQHWLAARAELEQERLGWAAPAPEDRAREPGSDVH